MLILNPLNLENNYLYIVLWVSGIAATTIGQVYTAIQKKYGLIKLKEDKKIKKVVMCSGKVYFDLIEAREKNKNNETVFIRVEQLYPFPVKPLARELKKYKEKSSPKGFA